MPKHFILKKDLQIPKVTDLQLAIVNIYNTSFRSYEWIAYLINKKEVALEMVLIVSVGFDKEEKTATMRHKIEKLPAGSVARIEYIPEELFALDNKFSVSFFLNNQIFEKDFVLPKNSISEESAQELALFNGSKGFVFE